MRIQIWTALIGLLLLKWLHDLSNANWSLSNLVCMLRLNLFTYRELMICGSTIPWKRRPWSPSLSNLPWLGHDLDRPL